MSVRKVNLPLLVLIGVPLFAVLASFGAAAMAILHGDPTLPDDYHWEGLKLDHDFARAQRAADLEVRALIEVLPQSHLCRVTLHLTAAPPATIVLTAIHGAHPALDRQLQLPLVAGSEEGLGSGGAEAARRASYEGFCESFPPGMWHVELGDAAGHWSLREEVSGFGGNVSLSARSPGG